MRMLFDGILTLVAPPRCAGCDEPSDEAALFCGACEASVERGGDPGAVFEYGGPVAEAIHRFKYDGRSELGFALGSVMAEQALRLADKVDGVVPVPLHWRRRRARGYDQSVLLCRPVAEALGVPALLRGLRRLKNTSSQVDLPHRERHRNVAGAFAPWRLHGARRVLLVDDVRTTGATLEAASRALKAGGVSQVHPFVLAARVLTRCT